MAALTTLIVYAALMLGIGFWASRRSADGEQYLLGGRALCPWVAGLSASASSSSEWTLRGVRGAAYSRGLSAIWLLPATLGGFLLNWWIVAPRLQRLSRQEQSLTLTEVVTPASLGDKRCLIARTIAAITLFCFIFYVANQSEGAAAFSVYFDVDRNLGIVLGVALGPILLLCLGGFDIQTNATLASIVAGFSVTEFLSFSGSPPGDWQERFLPLAASFLLAWSGRKRRIRSVERAP